MSQGIYKITLNQDAGDMRAREFEVFATSIDKACEAAAKHWKLEGWELAAFSGSRVMFNQGKTVHGRRWWGWWSWKKARKCGRCLGSGKNHHDSGGCECCCHLGYIEEDLHE